MADETAAPDAAIARLAALQRGVVSSAQLQAAGISREATRQRVRAGRLHPVFHGVYAVGHPGLSQESRWMSAVLACRGRQGIDVCDAFLSHRSAAAIWRLLPVRNGPIDVAIVGEAGRTRRAGLRIHRPRTLDLEMTTRKDGLPVTNPSRTLSDLRRAKPSRGGATAQELRRAMRQAAVLGLSLGTGARTDRTRSDLERLFIRICRCHNIAAPQVNIVVGGLEVDFLWRDRGLVVETDGYRYHRGRIAFENDHDRDLRLAELGFRVLRFSETQLENEPSRVASAVRSELAAD